MDEEVAKRHFFDALENSSPVFERFFLARFFGLSISYDEDPERCIVEFPYADFMDNPQGTLHGGVIAFALDVSMGHLCNRFVGTAITLDMNLRFLRPITDAARCEARFLGKGRSIVQVESRLFDRGGELAAVASSAWKLRKAPGGDGNGGE